MYQVHVRETPGRPRRAVAFTLAMICLATGAAALFVRHQRSDPSGSRVYPPGWSVSFVSPAGWVLVDVDRPAAEAGRLCFARPVQTADSSVLCVTRIRAWGTKSAQDICRDRMAAFFPAFLGPEGTRALLRRVEYESASLGPLPGVRATLAEVGDIFMVGVAGRTRLGTEAYLLEYHRDGALDAGDVTVFDTVTRSFERR